ncbi:CPBP family intramembrane glutamic endopeptidase [Lysinibacter cavernae]|uniref:Membrane protease YdiL (CAAX protease family) n=1 Tax=Lysinibacter cavernae TaxID=1640652 RepID=A0A7X5R2N4_9MICO|nr:CPBP family intramembrane glutamic endopeptidase [Lysinibacter cavernae]NIH54387.1 membrane protease YdiL (CAAX protease family) [Lysinibacter cavernae]
MTEPVTVSPWRRFWERGGWWRAVLLAAVYYALYQLSGLTLLPILSRIEDTSSPAYVLFAFAVPVALGGVLLVVFAWSMNWLTQLFRPQPIRGSWWMWIAVAVVLIFNILRFATIDYGAVSVGVVATWLLAGLFIGFAEETLTRGLVVTMLRKAHYREITVAVLSATVFSALHSGNLLTGQSLFATLIQLLYTFGFGICMYLALRVTGNLIWPILLHASTDPAIFLQTEYHVDGPLATLASVGNIPVIVVGLLLLIFIRGKVVERDAFALPLPAAR